MLFRLIGFGAVAALMGCGSSSSGAGSSSVVPPAPAPAPAPGIALLAGQTGGDGLLDANGSGARFHSPGGIATDAAGNVYVADMGNKVIRKISPVGAVSTLAGQSDGASDWPRAPAVDGNGAAARFQAPTDVAIDSAGNLYVTDLDLLRKVSPAGAVTTVAGAGTAVGWLDGNAADARFDKLKTIAIDPHDNIYVIDRYTMHKITPDGHIRSLAGVVGGVPSTQTTPVYIARDGKGQEASFGYPSAMAADALGNVYVVEMNAVRKVTPDGAVATLAGTRVAVHDEPYSNWSLISGIAIDANGQLVAAYPEKHKLYKVSPAGELAELPGTAGLVSTGDSNADQYNSALVSLAIDRAGNIYAAARDYHLIRKMSVAGTVSDFAGKWAAPGMTEGTGAASIFGFITFGRDMSAVAIDLSGNVIVSDPGNAIIRRITPAGVVATLAPLKVEWNLYGDPQAIAVDANLNVFLTTSTRVYKYSPQGSVTLLAGAPEQAPADGSVPAAVFTRLRAICVDAAGIVYVIDGGAIRQIARDGKVTTLAGSSAGQGPAYADGAGAAAAFANPGGIAIDAVGNLYVSDTDNGLIRKITPGGVVSTLAGTQGESGSADGVGAAARFRAPAGIALDAAGNVYVADRGNNTIRKIVPATGAVTTVVGKAGSKGVALGSLPGSLSSPGAIAASANGLLYVLSENAVLKVTLP